MIEPEERLHRGDREALVPVDVGVVAVQVPVKDRSLIRQPSVGGPTRLRERPREQATPVIATQPESRTLWEQIASQCLNDGASVELAEVDESSQGLVLFEVAERLLTALNHDLCSLTDLFLAHGPVGARHAPIAAGDMSAVGTRPRRLAAMSHPVPLPAVS